MPLNFPSSPVLNDTYTYKGKKYVWDGSAWAPLIEIIIKNNLDGGVSSSIYTIEQIVDGGSANG